MIHPHPVSFIVSQKNGGRCDEKNTVPPSADGTSIPVMRVWKAGSVSLSRPPIAAPAAGIYPPDQHHKSARFHAPGGSAGLKTSFLNFRDFIGPAPFFWSCLPQRFLLIP